MEVKPIVILPTYNEVENIGLLVPEILKELPCAHLLVVDDNSPDGTGKAVLEMGEKDGRIILEPGKMKSGYGKACIRGYRYALKRDYTHIFQMDVDFSHPPDLLPVLLKRTKEASVVAGSRYAPGGGTIGWGPGRKILSAGSNVFARCMTGLPYHDITGGFRCFRREVIEALVPEFGNIKSQGYVFLVDITVRIHRMGYSMAEVPFIFVNRVRGSSKMGFKIILEAVKQLFVLRTELNTIVTHRRSSKS